MADPRVNDSVLAESLVGSFISLMTKSNIRYEGFVHRVDIKEITIGLGHVRCYGTEGREENGQQIPPCHNVFLVVWFRGSELKDVRVLSSPSVHTDHELPDDPAIIQSYHASIPFSVNLSSLAGGALKGQHSSGESSGSIRPVCPGSTSSPSFRASATLSTLGHSTQPGSLVPSSAIPSSLVPSGPPTGPLLPHAHPPQEYAYVQEVDDSSNGQSKFPKVKVDADIEASFKFPQGLGAGRRVGPQENYRGSNNLDIETVVNFQQGPNADLGDQGAGSQRSNGGSGSQIIEAVGKLQLGPNAGRGGRGSLRHGNNMGSDNHDTESYHACIPLSSSTLSALCGGALKEQHSSGESSGSVRLVYPGFTSSPSFRASATLSTLGHSTQPGSLVPSSALPSCLVPSGPPTGPLLPHAHPSQEDVNILSSRPTDADVDNNTVANAADMAALPRVAGRGVGAQNNNARQQGHRGRGRAEGGQGRGRGGRGRGRGRGRGGGGRIPPAIADQGLYDAKRFYGKGRLFEPTDRNRLNNYQLIGPVVVYIFDTGSLARIVGYLERRPRDVGLVRYQAGAGRQLLIHHYLHTASALEAASPEVSKWDAVDHAGHDVRLVRNGRSFFKLDFTCNTGAEFQETFQRYQNLRRRN